jgi:L-amino acid N-acyltransferase
MIRPATAADAPTIAAIWNALIRDSAATFNSVEYTDAHIVQMIADRCVAGHAFFVDDSGGGFATYGQFRGGVGYAHSMEHSVHLSPAARGRGLGRALLLAVEDHARANGAHVMMAGVGGENTGGIAFHAACGYAHVATIPAVGWKFGRWMDLVLMQKFLS